MAHGWSESSVTAFKAQRTTFTIAVYCGWHRRELHVDSASGFLYDSTLIYIHPNNLDFDPVAITSVECGKSRRPVISIDEGGAAFDGESQGEHKFLVIELHHPVVTLDEVLSGHQY